MEPVSLLIVAAVAGGSMALGLTLATRRRAKTMEAWSAAAELVKGRFEPAVRRFWSEDPARVIATLEPGIEVTVDHFMVSTGKSSVIYTRVVAQAPGAQGLRLKLSTEGVLATVGKALGLGDLQLGDAAFDERFLVRGNDPAITAAWLSPKVRGALMESGREYGFALEDGAVKAQRTGLEHDPERLAAAMRAVAALAGGGALLVLGWRRLATALGGTLTDRIFIPGRIRFDTELEGRQLTIETCADPPSTLFRRGLGVKDAPRLELAAGEALDSLPGSALLFRAGAEAAWRAIQPARLTCDGETATVSFAGFIPDVARFRGATALVCAFEPRPSGPYR